MRSSARRAILRRIYGSAEGAVLSSELDEKIARHRVSRNERASWSERDAWLIAYPDQFSQATEAPLTTLARLLDEWTWLSGVHILPCYPWTSDDGFAVTDYEQIEPTYGTWDDIRRIGSGRTLMLDAVINHMSSESTWFREYLTGRREAFFVEEIQGADYSKVVRPRTTPLFHPFEAHDGERSVWTTFSADQVDLNYANPEVLAAVAEVLLEYCSNGAGALRLDAIGFLWKEPDTTSMHLPETHALIAVLAAVVREAYPGTLVVSEVNVPHAENITYLGTPEQPESDLIYQFTLAPLTLYAVHTGDCRPLVEWATELTLPRSGGSFLNFLASHDGVGVRPAEGLVPSIDPLLDAVSDAGGEISYRELADGSRAPYELNSTWHDLVGGVGPHLATHAVMLAMPGIPLIYAHSLFGSGNDHALFAATGRARSLNRHRFSNVEALRDAISDPKTREGTVFTQMRTMVDLRSSRPAFHPETPHSVTIPTPGVVRIDRIGDQRNVVVVNLTGKAQPFEAGGLRPIDGGPAGSDRLAPWEHRWFA